MRLTKHAEPHFFNRNVNCEVANGKDAQEGCVIAARVVLDLELGLKACPLAYPVFDAFCLLLRLFKGMFSMEDQRLVFLVQPWNQQSHLHKINSACRAINDYAVTMAGLKMIVCKHSELMSWEGQATFDHCKLDQHNYATFMRAVTAINHSAACQEVLQNGFHLMRGAMRHVCGTQTRVNSCACHPGDCCSCDNCHMPGSPM